MIGFRSRWSAVATASLLAVADLSWAAFYTSLELGRTTPITVSRAWLAMLLGTGGALLTWELLFGLWLRHASGLPLSSLMAKVSGSAAPLLLCIPFLIATYGSDEAFQYLFANRIPKALVQWTPLVIVLACQEATLAWNARFDGRAASWLHAPRSGPILIFVAFAILYVFSAGGHLYTPDEGYMYRATQKLAHSVPIGDLGTGAEPSSGGIQPAYSKYGLVTSLLAVPPYWISRVVGPQPDPPSAAFPIPNGAYPLVDLLVNPLLTAATCALLYCLARQFGFRPSSSLIVVLLYGLTTSAWVYAKTFLSQPPAALFLLVAVYLLMREKPAGLRYTLAGISLGMAVGSRAELLSLAAPLIIPMLRTLRREPSLAARPTAAFVVAFLFTGGATLGWYDWVKTGYIWATGHGAQGTLAAFSPQPYVGLLGTFTSPGFSLLLYNPVVLLGLLSLPLLIRRYRWKGIFVTALLALSVAFYGSLGDWIGGFTWGNRYLVVILPFAVLPVGALLEAKRLRFLARLAAASVGMAGFCITFLAVLFDFNSGWLDLWGRNARQRFITWDPSYSPILAHIRLLHDFLYTGAKLDLYIFYKLGFPSLLLFLLLFAGVLTLAIRAVLASGCEASEAGKVSEVLSDTP
jgi:hypothetical protein